MYTMYVKTTITNSLCTRDVQIYDLPTGGGFTIEK